MIILMYHGVLPDDVKDPILAYGQVHKSAFEWQMRFLKRYFPVLALGTLIEMLKSGQKPSPGTIVITLDDGLSNNAQIAYPVLKKYGLPATFFVSTAPLTSRSPLWFNILAEKAYRDTNCFKSMPARLKIQHLAAIRRKYFDKEPAAAVAADCGIKPLAHTQSGIIVECLAGMTLAQLQHISIDELVEIGSHTVTHPRLSRCSEHQLDYELTASKQQLEAICGKEIRFFAYPQDDRTLAAINAVKRAGYEAALAVNTPTQMKIDLYQIPRIGIYGDSKIKFLVKCFLRYITSVHAQLS